MRLSDFNVLSFDCYGTLIDWETGILEALAPLRLGASQDATREPPTRDQWLARFAVCESAQEARTPTMPYPEVLTTVYEQLAAAVGVTVSRQEAEAFGDSVGKWPAFPDTVQALQYLARHYRLVILSNVDRRSFSASNARLGVDFDAVHTAEDIGTYKPDPRNFGYLTDHVRDDFGFGTEKILHVAQSLFHDHLPAAARGLATAWIDRRHAQAGWGATPAPTRDPRVDFRFESMQALVAAHRAEGQRAEGQRAG